MKKCPTCNRTYSDETLSFCLEDGSLLSASVSFYEEQETVIRPGKVPLAPTELFSPATNDYHEKPTAVSAKNISSNLTQPSKEKSKTHITILSTVWVIFILAAVYTASLIPLIAALIITLLYAIVMLIYGGVRKLIITRED